MAAIETYAVPRRDSQTVLDVVTYVQRHIDPTLSYRFACRVGMCGSCAMTVNGRPRWTCRTHVAKVAGDGGRLEIGPLENLPVIKDLATDMAAVLREVAEGQGRVRAVADAARRRSRTSGPTRRRAHAADAAIECINCGVCYAGCDTVRWNADYLGPAALTRPGRWSTTSATPAIATAAGDRSHRRLPRLPLAPILPGALPADAQSDRLDRRAEAAHHGRLSERRDQSMNVRLYIWQRATAALMAPLVLVHIAVIFYATRQGLTAADILSRTRGSIAVGARITACSSPRFPSMPPSACATCWPNGRR